MWVPLGDAGERGYHCLFLKLKSLSRVGPAIFPQLSVPVGNFGLSLALMWMLQIQCKPKTCVENISKIKAD